MGLGSVLLLPLAGLSVAVGSLMMVFADQFGSGAGVYNGFCLKCHGVDGLGKPGKFPALAGNPSVLQPNPDSLIRLLIEGSTAPATATGPAPEKMPAFATKISDTDMADVLTYIRRNWGNQANAVTHRAAGKLHATLREQKQSELGKQGRPLPQ